MLMKKLFSWATQVIRGDDPSQSSTLLTPAKKAAVFLVWAQAIEYHDTKTGNAISR
jgi:hypothetical protein